MAGPAEVYSIVIVGNMNPRIHHPAWYEAVEVLSREEARVAVASPVMCTPALSQVQFDGLAVLCLQDRWEIQSQDARKLERMLDIAGRTFDTLMHTPIAAFGLNFHFVRPAGLQDVGLRLAELGNDLPLGRKAGASDSALIVTTTALPGGRVLQETVSGVPEAAGYVRVAYNVNHPIQVESVLFELAPLLRAALKEDYPECLGRAEQVAKALSVAQKE